MKYVFSLDSGYDEDDLLELNRLYAKRNPGSRAVDIILRTVKIVVAVVLIYAGFIGAAKSQTGTLMRVLFVLVGGLALLSGLFHNRVRAFRGKRMMQKQISSVQVTLDDDGITETTNAGENTAAYSDVEDIVYQKERWFLFLKDGHAVLLPKSCMKGGSTNSFEKRLTELTGREIQHNED